MDDVAFFDTSPYDVRGGVFSSMCKKDEGTKESETPTMEKAPVDMTTSAEDPASATAETPAVRKRRPTKSQTMEHPIKIDPDIAIGLPRTDTAPADLGAAKKASNRKSLLSTGLASSLFEGRNTSSESLSKAKAPDDNAHASSSSTTLSSSAPTASTLVGAKDGTNAGITPAGLPRDPSPIRGNEQASVTTSRNSPVPWTPPTDVSLGHENSISPAAVIDANDASTASIMNSLRARDKKALQSQAKLVGDNFKKGWASFASKRGLNIKPASEVKEPEKPPPAYRPPEEDSEAAAGGRTSMDRPMSLKERLDVAAHAKAAAAAGTNSTLR